jgi:hypothetical protein
MSDIKDETVERLARMAAEEKKKKEVASKKLILEERRVNYEIEKLVKNDKELAIAKTTNFGAMTQEQIEKTQKDSTDYILAARSCMEFINSSFNGIVPFFRKNLILIGGKTGEGKSTTVANMIASTMKQKDPLTGKRCRVLALTNEEKTEDVYNRITCFARGWNYVNHDKFTDEQIKTFEEYITVLAKDGWLTVVDDNFGSTPEAPVSGVTTSIEGIQSILDNLIASGEIYSLIAIDYYQNIKTSKTNPHLVEWQVQEKLIAMLDQYKNIYPAPIVLMAQVKPPAAENPEPFKVRIEGRKTILNVCTCCIEMVADRDNLRTEWHIHKSRFNESIGSSFFTGYDKGRFVPYTAEFQANANRIRELRAARDHDRSIGMTEPAQITQEEPTNE